MENSIPHVPAMDCDRSVLPELLLGFVHLSDEVDEAFAGLGNPLFGPIGELELSDRPGRSVPGVRHFEFPQDVLRHVVLGDGVHHEALVAHRTFAGPVLMAFLLKKYVQGRLAVANLVESVLILLSRLNSCSIPEAFSPGSSCISLWMWPCRFRAGTSV
ncbi:unnamed protein product [Callosobruchus maculatus]|uniref:Uncharacterized protein n=1 Tax=Callosobruchus maculatus TaxID=64391 RepID=A0A653DU91_CALMS|nr:unnamed protein product [Callosobruchus maculatus]